MRRSIGACVLAAAVLLAIVPASAGERKVPARTRGSSGQDRSTSLLSAPALWDYVPEEILVTFEPQVARATRSAACTGLSAVSATAARATEYFRTAIEALLRRRLSRRRR